MIELWLSSLPFLMCPGRRASGPLSSIPSNVMDEDLPMLDSAVTGDTSKQPTAGTAKAAAAAGRRAGRRAAAAAAGGGGGPEDSDHDMTDADGAHGEQFWQEDHILLADAGVTAGQHAVGANGFQCAVGV